MTSDEAEFIYKTTNYYAPGHQQAIIYNDPILNIDWPFCSSALSLSQKIKKQNYFQNYWTVNCSNKVCHLIRLKDRWLLIFFEYVCIMTENSPKYKHDKSLISFIYLFFIFTLIVGFIIANTQFLGRSRDYDNYIQIFSGKEGEGS